MRSVPTSTAVFAKIWALRQEGEETEDAVLRRILGLPKAPTESRDQGFEGQPAADGFHDPKFGVHFPEGLEIFRNYKGTDFRARATRGRLLLLNNNQHYPSLHKLSRAVVHGHENSWLNWKFEDRPGKYALIDKLRDQSKVAARAQRLSLEDF